MNKYSIGRIRKIPLLFLIAAIVAACIETDIEDPLTESLRIIEPEETFRVSGQYELFVEYIDDTGEPVDVSVIWESSNSQILQMNGNVATCLAEGQVFVNVTAGNKTASLLVEIEPSREFIEISNFVEVLETGNSFTFQTTYMNVSGAPENIVPVWNSSDNSIATVDEAGEVVAVSAGMANITASFGNVSHQVAIEVTSGPVLVDPEVRITTFKMFFEEGDTFTFEAQYFGEDGQPDPSVDIIWSSSNSTALTINDAGLATATAVGNSTVTASSGSISASIDVTIEATVTERTGTLSGTGYNISGSFKLSKNSDGDLILNVNNYVTAGPGPYFYLSNQDGNVANGVNLGEAKTNGNIEINVTAVNSSVDLKTYRYLVIWCEPFGVRLGFGEFDN